MIPAFAYTRMSSEPQALSIDQQKHEVEKLADKEGYKILGWYSDPGVSASKKNALKFRKEFGAMLADMRAGKDKAQCVLCYDVSRFTRLDSVDANEYAQLLRDAGVWLHTTVDGRIDWRTEEGRMKWYMMVEFANKYPRSLSHASCRGRNDVLRLGWWAAGAIPYGYDRAIHSEDGAIRILPRNVPSNKGRREHVKLSVNQAEATIVKWMFDCYVNRSWSQRRIAAQLNEDGIPPPDQHGGKKPLNGWTHKAVQGILRNCAYSGSGHLGIGKRRTKDAFNRTEENQVSSQPVIIDRQLWLDAQILLKQNAETGGDGGQRKGSSAFRSILFCGECGYRLSSCRRASKHLFFKCDQAIRRPHMGCKQWWAYEHEIAPIIIRELLKAFDEEILAALKAEPDKRFDDLSLIRKQRDDLTDDLTEGQRKLPKIKEQHLEAYQAELDSITQEIGKLNERIEMLEQAASEPSMKDLVGWWQDNRVWLADLAEGEVQMEVVDASGTRSIIATNPRIVNGELISDSERPFTIADPDKLNTFLKRAGVKVTLFWKWEPHKAKNVRKWLLDKAKLRVEISRQELGLQSNSYNHGNNRDKD